MSNDTPNDVPGEASDGAPGEPVHVMVDLETLGNRPDAAIAAIGAVAFTSRGIITGKTSAAGRGIVGEPFYRRVSLESSMMRATVDASTICWWLKQGEEARIEVADAKIHIVDALADFSAWMKFHDPAGVWGNGAAFDNVILRSAYTAWDIPAPWRYSQDRCFRTTKALFGHNTGWRSIKALREGARVHHRADHDAIWQAEHLIDMAMIAFDGGTCLLEEAGAKAAKRKPE